MNEQDALNQIVKLLGGEHGLAPQIIGWIGALRVPMKIFAVRITKAIDKAIQAAAGTPSVEDDAFINTVLRSRAYRWAAFLVDWVASVKLPQPIAPAVKEEGKP